MWELFTEMWYFFFLCLTSTSTRHPEIALANFPSRVHWRAIWNWYSPRQKCCVREMSFSRDWKLWQNTRMTNSCSFVRLYVLARKLEHSDLLQIAAQNLDDPFSLSWLGFDSLSELSFLKNTPCLWASAVGNLKAKNSGKTWCIFCPISPSMRCLLAKLPDDTRWASNSKVFHSKWCHLKICQLYDKLHFFSHNSRESPCGDTSNFYADYLDLDLSEIVGWNSHK